MGWLSEYGYRKIDANITENVAPTGTISVTNGSATVTGSSTNFRKWRAGDKILLPDTNWWIISAIASNTSLTLTGNYTGATLSGQSYKMMRVNYQLEYVVDAASGGSGHLHCNNHCPNFPAGIRFTKDDGTTLITHSLKSYNGGATPKTATFVLEFPELRSDSVTDIYMYYGNSSAGFAFDRNGTYHFDENYYFNDFFIQDVITAEGSNYGEPTAISDEVAGQIDLWYTHADDKPYYTYTSNGLDYATPQATDIPSGYKRPHILKLGNTYFFYATRDADSPRTIRLFTGTNKINFTDQGVVLNLGAGGQWDDYAFGNSFVWYELEDSAANTAEELDASETAIDTTDGTKFCAGCYIKIEDEIILVGAVSGNTLTGCTRGALGTTPTTHSNATDIYIYRWKMLYEAYDGSTNWKIGLATADTPTGFNSGKSGSNPVFTGTGTGVGNPELARVGSEVIKDSGNYIMYYHGQTTGYPGPLGRAYSANLTVWTDEGDIDGVVETFPGGSHGDHCLAQFRGNTYLWYSPSNQVDTSYINLSIDRRAYATVIASNPMSTDVWSNYQGTHAREYQRLKTTNAAQAAAIYTSFAPNQNLLFAGKGYAQTLVSAGHGTRQYFLVKATNNQNFSNGALGIRLNYLNGAVDIYDNEVSKASTAFSFTDNTWYNFEFWVKSDYAIDLYVWVVGGSKPGSPTLTYTGFTPAASGTNIRLATVDNTTDILNYWNDCQISYMADTAPTLGAAGSEETPTAAGSLFGVII